MKIFITGGCGFIGTNLTRMLIENSHFVTIFDNLTTGNIENIKGLENVDFIKGDIRDSKKVQECCAGHDAIIHLAAFGSVIDSVASPWENFEINVMGTLSVLDAAKNSDIRHIITASTGGALIGNAKPPVDENSVPRPISPYGASKLSGEGYCSAYANSYNLNITSLRFANVIGPYSWHKKGAVTAFMKSIITRDEIVIYGDGSATRDFLYVDDLCNGINLALNRKNHGYKVYHLSGGEETSIKSLLDLIIVESGIQSIKIVKKDKRAGEVNRNFANYELAFNELGFKPKTELKLAISKTWKWFNEQI